jgi:hypothetical protein
MATASFRFHGELADFLPRARRGTAFAYACARAATLKNAIEALGVPHTEAALVLVNGAPATLPRIVREGDSIEVFPWPSRRDGDTPQRPAFLADAHLGGLARFLRMLGYDTLQANAMTDREIRSLAAREPRIVLSRDRELLKCRDIVHGSYVHALRPEEQLREVAARYDLAARARPFTLCLVCNVQLESVAKQAILERLPPAVAASRERFMHCARCGRVYWEGSHFARMQAVLARVLPGQAPPPG